MDLHFRMFTMTTFYMIDKRRKRLNVVKTGTWMMSEDK